MVGSWLRSCLFDWTYWMQAPMHVLFQSCHELLWAYILSRKPVWQKETCMSFPFMTLDSFRFKIELSSIWLLDCTCDIEDLISWSLGPYFLFVVAYGRLKLWKRQCRQCSPTSWYVAVALRMSQLSVLPEVPWARRKTSIQEAHCHQQQLWRDHAQYSVSQEHTKTFWWMLYLRALDAWARASHAVSWPKMLTDVEFFCPTILMERKYENQSIML